MKMLSNLTTFSAAFVTLALAGGASASTALPATDLDTLDLGSPVDEFTGFTWNFTYDSNDDNYVGRLDSNIWFNDQTELFTYQYTVAPAEHLTDVGYFRSADWDATNYGIQTQGFSFSDAASAGAPGDASSFDIEFTDDLHLIFTPSASWDGEQAWSGGETINFFFQTARYPVQAGRFRLMNNEEAGYALGHGFTPTPVPAAAMAGLPVLGLLALGYAIRRRS